VGRLAAVALVAVTAVLVSCTPAQYQAWWTSQGNAPLAEPQLSEAAAAATRYWAEVARQNRYRWSASTISPALAQRMTPSSWRAGCPVPLTSLRHLRVSFMGFDGSERTGDLVVHVDQVERVAIAFELLWDANFRIERMQLVDDFGGDDAASMAANNTSAFNCRRVAGSSSWSQHSYGRAIDINPVQNPYVSGSTVSPPAGGAYLDRGHVRPGMIVADDAAVRSFAAVGWSWGGAWARTKDYQHFSLTGT